MSDNLEAQLAIILASVESELTEARRLWRYHFEKFFGARMDDWETARKDYERFGIPWMVKCIELEDQQAVLRQLLANERGGYIA